MLKNHKIMQYQHVMLYLDWVKCIILWPKLNKIWSINANVHKPKSFDIERI
jgi:hypothetical protein